MSNVLYLIFLFFVWDPILRNYPYNKIVTVLLSLLKNALYIYIYIYTGLFEMIVGVLTTCHTQYT